MNDDAVKVFFDQLKEDIKISVITSIIQALPVVIETNASNHALAATLFRTVSRSIFSRKLLANTKFSNL